MKIKLLSLLLALLMLAGALISCANDPADAETTTEGASEPTAEVTENVFSKYDVKDNLPEGLTFGGQTIKIMSRGRSWCIDEVSVEEASGDQIGDAVYERNKAVEQRLGVKIENVFDSGKSDNYEIVDKITLQVTTQGKDINLICASTYASIRLTYTNIFQDMNDIEYLDLDREYWMQGFNEAASYKGSQFFVTGPICLSTYRFVFAYFFNKALFEDEGEAEPYEYVKNKSWTIDKVIELTEKFHIDIDSNGSSESDILGFISNNDMIGVDPYWSAFKLPILLKNTDGEYELSLDKDRVDLAVSKLNKLYWDTDGAYGYKQESGDSEQEKIAEKFSHGEAAMACMRLIEAEGAYLTKMDDKYGIVPVPMLNKEQTDYASYMHDTFSSYAIPANQGDDRNDMYGAFLEAMASESYKHVTPVYYEIVMKNKLANDILTRDMLDIITSKIYVDAGILYTKSIESVHQKLRTLVGTKQSSAITTLRMIERKVPSYVTELNKGLDKAVAFGK